MTPRPPRFGPSPTKQKKLVAGFLQAIDSGNMEGLIQLLAQDVVMQTNGGGKEPAVARSVTGQEAMVRLLLGIYRLAPADTRIVTAHVNGSPGLLFQVQDSCWGCYLYRHQIQAIHNLLNPEKLTHLERQRDVRAKLRFA